MEPKTFLFFGRSGSGKGTQAALLQDLLKKKDPEKEVLYVETGSRLRSFAKEKGYVNGLTNNVLTTGGLLPEFMPIWIWTDFFIKNMNGNEHLVLDGLSRRVPEAPVLDGALDFFNRKDRYIILINTSVDWSAQRLMERGRVDDKEEEIRKRLTWFDENVVPAVEYYRKSPKYTFLDIDGEQSIEKVHEDICKGADLA